MYLTPHRMVASALVAATLSLVVAQASSSASSAGSSTVFPPPQAPPPGVLDLVSHSSPNFELFPGVMSVSWWYMPNLETPTASIITFRLSVTEGSYAGIGAAQYPPMGGPIVVCYVPPSAPENATCINYLGQPGGGLGPAPQANKLLWSSIEKGTATVEFEVNVSTMQIPIPNTDINSLIAAHGSWGEGYGPYYHGYDENATTVYVNLTANSSVEAQGFATVGTPSSPLYVVFDSALAFQWKVEFAAPGDVLEVTLCVALGFYGGIGFANAGMEGPITACFVNQSDATDVVCRDVIGQKGGGVQPNPVQYSRVLSSALNPENTTVTLRIPIASLNLSYDPRTQDARLIFAYGYWNASAALPTFHGPNATHARVGLYDGRWHSTPFPTELPFIPTPAPTPKQPEIRGK